MAYLKRIQARPAVQSVMAAEKALSDELAAKRGE